MQFEHGIRANRRQFAHLLLQVSLVGLTIGMMRTVISDRYGRQMPNVWGMWVCGAGVAMMLAADGMVWWSLSAAVSGFGMALLYPNLSAAVADISHPAWRGSAIGIYRFWRDLGYAIGALGIGLASHFSGQMESAFVFVAVSMGLSGAVLYLFGEETHPRLNPAPLATSNS